MQRDSTHACEVLGEALQHWLLWQRWASACGAAALTSCCPSASIYPQPRRNAAARSARLQHLLADPHSSLQTNSTPQQAAGKVSLSPEWLLQRYLLAKPCAIAAVASALCRLDTASLTQERHKCNKQMSTVSDAVRTAKRHSTVHAHPQVRCPARLPWACACTTPLV